jgi:hypothetical protein
MAMAGRARDISAARSIKISAKSGDNQKSETPSIPSAIKVVIIKNNTLGQIYGPFQRVAWCVDDQFRQPADGDRSASNADRTACTSALGPSSALTE